jgi:ketosteroid isomerase-like protein
MNDNKSLLRQMFQEVFAGTDLDETLIRRYFSENYTQTVDGETLGFGEFLQHMLVLKQATKSLSVRFKTLIQEDNVVFSNHFVSGVTVEGRSVEAHVMAEFRFQKGKIISCDELTRVVSGSEADRDLGSRH